jgi:serine/threonine-protein kinase ULK/ATG1
MIATDAYLKESLSTEIAIMKKLKHRNIVELIDTVTTANSIYLVLEFCKDGDLKRYSMNKRFTEDQALEILNQLIAGFSAIVKEGIIHRDLKPANVLVHDGVFKICDFGFAKYFGELNRMVKTCVGTPIYMSPQVLKQKPYTSKSDIWSLGVMYYELLFGKIPFLGKS